MPEDVTAIEMRLYLGQDQIWSEVSSGFLIVSAGSWAPYIHVILSYVVSITWYITQPLVRLLLRITNPQLVIISFAQVQAAQWSDTIPTQNIWFTIGIHLTLFCFNTPTKLNYDSPILDLNCSTLTTGKDFVNRSAGLSIPATWKGSMTLFSYCSWMKWCWMSICLVQHSTAGFTVRNIAAWLSKHNGIGPWM